MVSALLARLLILVIWQHVLTAYKPYPLINLLLNEYKWTDLKMVFWIRCRKDVSLCRCQIFCRKITQTRLFDEICWKKTRKWPSSINETFSYLIQVYYIKRTTYKNLDLFYIKYRKPFANRLENTLSVANPYWMIEWRTPCIFSHLTFLKFV